LLVRNLTRSLTLLASAALVVGACSSSGATASPGGASAAPSSAPSSAPSAAPSTAPAPGANAWKVGVVTDVGTINDKNFNEYTYKGAQAGATAVGVTGDVPFAVPKAASEYASLIQNFVSQGFNIVVTTGFNLSSDTTKAAKANPNVWFIGVDQAPICVDEKGDPDPKFACKGDPAVLLPHYIGLQYAEDQAGYLAGMVAATASKSGIISAIGGITICAVCVKYIQGYELGAKFINPNIQVKTAYVTTSDFKKAFGDPVTGKAFAQQFIQQNKPDVLFQVAGLTGNGMIDAACAAGIWAVGVDVDQYLSYPNGDKCIITSAEKHLAISVSDAIKHIADGSAKGGNRAYDAKNDGIGVSDFHDKASMFPPALTAALGAQLALMQAGTLQTCPPPPQCGAPPK
jgi:basic membrane protein A